MSLVDCFNQKYSSFCLFFSVLKTLDLLLICIPINFIGILYIIFVLKEGKSLKPAAEENGVDNPTFENIDINDTAAHRPANTKDQRSASVAKDKGEEKKKNFIIDFFNPIVAVQCIQVIMRKRENKGRSIVILLFVMYFIAIGPSFGEEPNEYNFTRLQLNWGGLQFTPFATYGIATALVGSIVMVYVFSKLLKISDAILGIIGASLSAVSRVLYVSQSYAKIVPELNFN